MTYLPTSLWQSLEGIDYLATALGLVGMYLLPSRKRTAIILFLIGNALWLAWGLQTGSHGIIANYILMGCLNARTLWTWAREARAVQKLQLQGAS